ncbi:MAG TPA: PD-(D/E)XK nuclease family protein [Limnobacter sp.]|nr:PD-(D/E)XK nuclease family protein [Limnobacter sp.]
MQIDLSGRKAIQIRASSLSSLIDCPARWIAIHLEQRKSPSSDKAAMGTAIHAGTALFDAERLAGQVPSVAAATEAAVHALTHGDEEVVWETEVQKCASIVAGLTSKYCREESPQHEFLAVEAKCESLLIEDLSIVLSGTVDRIKIIGDSLGIADLKSGKTAVSTQGQANTKGHAAQMGVYELLGEQSIGRPIDAPATIIGLQTNQTPDKQRIASAQIHDAKSVLFGPDGQPGLLEIAARIVHGDMPAWGNPESTMCTNVYCPVFNTCFWRK